MLNDHTLDFHCIVLNREHSVNENWEELEGWLTPNFGTKHCGDIGGNKGSKFGNRSFLEQCLYYQTICCKALNRDVI